VIDEMGMYGLFFIPEPAVSRPIVTSGITSPILVPSRLGPRST
jgi:hypothetical protein